MGRMKRGYTYQWNKETIQHLLEKNDLAVLRALVQIYNRQTDAEQQSENTHEYNKIGFTGFDGEILASFAKQYLDRGVLSPKQFRITRKRMKHYWKQLQQIAIENGKNPIVPKLIGMSVSTVGQSVKS